MKAQVYSPQTGRGYVQLVHTTSREDIPIIHVRPPAIAPADCVRVIQEYESHPGTVQTIGVYTVGDAGDVGAPDGIPSMLPLATAVFLNGQPCFWRYRLSYPVMMTGDVPLWHPPAPVRVYGTQARLVAVPYMDDLYWIDVYLTEPVTGAYVVYEAFKEGIKTWHREPVYPVPSTRTDTIDAVASAYPTEPVMAVNPFSPSNTLIYVPVRPVPDTRQRLQVRWRVEIWEGYSLSWHGDWNEATLLPAEQVTPADNAQDGWFEVHPDATALLPPGTTLSEGQYLRVTVEDNPPGVEARLNPQGESPNPVYLRWNAGVEPLDLCDEFTLADGQFVPKICVGALDYQLPRVTIGGYNLHDPWHIRVHVGRYQKTVDGVTYIYSLPEYWQDRFHPTPPYAAKEEAPIRIDRNTFRVTGIPIAQEIPVRAIIRQGSQTIELTVTEVDPEYGIVRTKEAVPERAELVILYSHRKDYVNYRGSDGHYLDLNPRHLSHIPLSKTWVLSSSRRLIGQTIYLYWLPYAVLENGVERQLRHQTLRHTFAPLEETDPDYATAILLARIEISLPYAPASLRIKDARRRGGGLAEDLKIPPHMQAHVGGYADIGHWDGREVPMAGTYVIELAPWSPVSDPGFVRTVAEERGPHGQLPLVYVIQWPEKTAAPPDALMVDFE